MFIPSSLFSSLIVVNITKDSGPLAQEPLIPQWGIAVIVIGLASLLFVIIFGVTVVSRHFGFGPFIKIFIGESFPELDHIGNRVQRWCGVVVVGFGNWIELSFSDLWSKPNPFFLSYFFLQLVNRHKNSKKKNAVSLTQEMLSEFNKSHMGSGAGGLDNYGADDLYNMDDVWNDRQMDKTFDRKPTKVRWSFYSFYIGQFFFG